MLNNTSCEDMQTLRFADPATVTQYPLPIPAAAGWRDTSPGKWEVLIPLPVLAAGAILAPSLSVLGEPDYRYRFTLITPGKDYPLRPVPATRDDGRQSDPGDARVRTAIDCFHTGASLADCALRVALEGSRLPRRYLLTVSIRPTEQEVPAPPELPCIHARRPDPLSQMLANPRIARRICSPISTAMVMRSHEPRVQASAVTEACFDPVTGLYGMWPLAIRAASLHGMIGAVELFSDWTPALTCLRAGLPLVASIRYRAGELPGAPQAATGGHLVVVWGIQGDQVLVHDPAAPVHGSVGRRYPLSAFSGAWFRHRGAAYILSP